MAGYGAVVVTLDTFLHSRRERDIQNSYPPFLRGEGLASYFSDPVFRAAIGGDPGEHPVRAVEHFAGVFSDPSRTWDDLARLRRAMRLPILLKGILHPEDAKRAVDQGWPGSSSPTTAADRSTGRSPRWTRYPAWWRPWGADVIKALALGATCVLLGRPYCFGLAVNGEQGVRDVVANLVADVDLTLGLCGCASVAELGRGNLAEAPPAPPSPGLWPLGG